MNVNMNPIPSSATTSSDPHLVSSPSTELIQRALTCRIWSLAEHPAGAPQEIPEPVISNTLTQVSYAWCAGFLDGEGCISMARIKRNCGNRINYRIKVSIPQNCKETLMTFREFIGENSFLSQVTHRDSYTRPIYQLVYDGIHASNLLHKLRPYLVRKGAEADVVFQFYRDGQPTRHFGPKGVPTDIWHIRERCFDALRHLK